MKKEDWLRVGKWMGYVYLPIVLLAAVVFILIQLQQSQPTRSVSVPPQATTTTP